MARSGDSTSHSEPAPAPDSSPGEPGPGSSSRLGTLISGTYRLVRHIGSGGMSDVFAAEHVRLGKTFAVKLLRPDMSVARRAAERLRREARAVAAVSSEYIVGIQDCGEMQDGTPFLVMELLDGEDLRSLLERETALPVPRAANLLLDACRGLAAAHARNLVHRDLKPENLFVTRHATGEDWCKVLDFGVAKMEASQSTAPGAIIGTIRYMAPEQLADSATVGPATDVYALGAILYECLGGQPAHLGQTMQELMFQVMNQQPKPLAMLRPALPEALAELVTQCLQKSASARPTLAELTDSMHAFSHRAPTAASSATLAEGSAAAEVPSWQRARRSRRLLPAFLLGLLGLSLGWLAGAWQRDQVASREQSPAGPTRPESAAPTAPIALPQSSPPSPSTTAQQLAPAPATETSVPRRRPAAIPPPSGAASAKPRARNAGRFDEANPYQE